MSLSKDLFDSGKNNNIAILSFKYIFSALLTIGTILAILAETSGNSVWPKYCAPKMIVFYVIIMHLVFACLIFIIGEPTKYGWKKVDLIKSLKDKKYIQRFNYNEAILEHSIDNLKKYFSKNWSYLWGAWSLLYLAFFIRFGMKIHFPEFILKSVNFSYLSLTLIENALNFLSSYFLFALYLILVHKSEFKSEIIDDKNISYHQDRKKFIFMCIFLIIAELISYLTLFSMYPDFVLPGKGDEPSEHVGYFLTISKFFKICNGLIGSISLTLFISRLIGSHTTVFHLKEIVVLPILFLYCAIQPLYLFVAGNENPLISFGVLSIALLCKFLLYYIVVDLFDSKRILFHFIETMSIKENVLEKLPCFEKVWEEKDAS
ncbi:MAG: hypothetical protein ACKVU0_16790 [Saprospiraceae bacterium]